MSVFTWGFGKNGQLGQGNRESAILPLQIAFVVDRTSENASPSNNISKNSKNASSNQNKLGKIKRISAGGLMTGILAKNGSLYFCGSGAHGRLGTSDESDQLYPMKVDIPSTDEILEVRFQQTYIYQTILKVVQAILFISVC